MSEKKSLSANQVPTKKVNRKISASVLIADIRSGMDYENIIAKHNLSSKNFDDLCRKLVDAGRLEPPDLPSATHPSRGETKTAWRCPACGKPQSGPVDECPDCGVIVVKFLEKQEKTAALEASKTARTEDPPQEEKKTMEATANFCHKCGQKLLEESSFCSSCGTQITSNESADDATTKESQSPDNKPKWKGGWNALAVGAWGSILTYFTGIHFDLTSMETWVIVFIALILGNATVLILKAANKPPS